MLKFGKIPHYYDKIGVAVLAVNEAPLKTGETIKITDNEGSDFSPKVTSMQVEHQNIPEAKVGEVGLKVEQEVKATRFIK